VAAAPFPTTQQLGFLLTRSRHLDQSKPLARSLQLSFGHQQAVLGDCSMMVASILGTGSFGKPQILVRETMELPRPAQSAGHCDVTSTS
jgi:hypothetical protein